MSVQEVFNQSATEYDQARRKLVPCFDDLYGVAVAVIPFERAAPLRVLDLGAGTGLLAGLVLDAFPSAHVTLVDVADAMLARAHERFADRADRVDFRVMNYAAAGLGGPYDLVVSALSIHHLEDEQKRSLFARVHSALVPGGFFVNAEQVRGASAESDRVCRDLWRERMRAAGATDEDFAGVAARSRYDRLAELESQLAWLREAGFRDVDCYYHWLCFAVYAGRR